MARFLDQLRTLLVMGCLTINPISASAHGPTVGTTVGAGDPEPGIEAFLKGSYPEAQRALATRARLAHGPSQYYLGLMYLRGHAGDFDEALAYAWFAAGEANGHRPSRVMRRKLHPRLAIGNLPRAESLARQHVYKFSGVKLAPAPCFKTGVNHVVVACDQHALVDTPVTQSGD